jgi:pimeloyl-ACP methyl ester carboxylesterase
MSRLALAAAAAFLPLACLAAADPAPVTVTMPDGYTVRGNYARETETATDGKGRAIRVTKTDGFDVIQDGAKFVIFSTHAGKGGTVDPGLGREPLPVYTTALRRIVRRPVLPIARIKEVTPFDARWQRNLDTVTTEGQMQRIRQQIVKLDPESFTLDSPSDDITQAYQTSEESPENVTRWLSLHPDLRDPPGGKVDPDRRLRVASFLKDVAAADGTRSQAVWLRASRRELDRLKKDVPEPWDAKITERYNALTDALDSAETRTVVDELEAALKCGRYADARQFLAGFNPKTTDTKEANRLAAVRAAVEAVQPQYDRTAALLRAIIERESGMGAIVVAAAVAGSPAAIFTPRPTLPPEMTTLLEASAAVLGELHPDTAERLELFHDLARQSEARREKGLSPSETTDALLAYAVSGWLRGKNGADKSVPSALRSWRLRTTAVDALAGPSANARVAALDGGLKALGDVPTPDEIAQVVSLMPPPAAVDLANPPWKPVPIADADGVPGIVRVNTGTLPEIAKGVDYCLRLPPEYHHGRSYPLILALPAASLPAERLVARLAEQAQRNGYIVAAPEWTSQFGDGQYDFSGKQHPVALAVLRDMLRRFNVDADKVFLFGFAEGASFALDLGMAHPDLFAGLAGFNVNLPPQVYLEYWHNNQKLPTHFVLGELTGALPTVRKVYEKWMPRGFPAMLTVYRGRGAEWFTPEVPRLFDWMGRKSRVRGSGTLRLDKFAVEPWQVLRPQDDRYYWVGIGEGGTRYGNPLENGVPPYIGPPPQFAADIGRNGVVTISHALGVRRFVIWLQRDLIDWTKPVRVSVNGTSPVGYKPKIMTPDLRLMFEELYRTGDRKMLFLGKLEVGAPG